MNFGNKAEIKYEGGPCDIYGNIWNVLNGFLSMVIFVVIICAF